jgi:8-oxo-dGTP pyrophosphatase MutT (NUDIX family)
MPNNYVFTQPFVITGALIVRDNKVLLIQENHYPDKGKWNMPAGKLELGESPLDAVKREVFEESGLDFTPTGVLGIHSVHRKDIVQGELRQIHAIRLFFLGDIKGEVSLEHGDNRDGEKEIANYKWLTPEEVLATDNIELRYHDTKQLVEQYLAGKKYPLSVIEHFLQT